jgi:homoserine kinase
MKGKILTVYAPASSGNVSVGFDALGLALAPIDGSLLGDCVSIIEGEPDDWMLCIDGPFAHALPQDQEQNIVISSCRRFETAARAKGAEIRPLNITLDKRLPVGSGMGSSASSIVATLVALNRHFGRPLDRPALLQMMAEMEGSISGEIHLDNIAPCLLGGLRLCIPGGARQYSLPWPAHWQSVVAWPGTRLDTRSAREVLPEHYERRTVVSHGAHLPCSYTCCTRVTHVPRRNAWWICWQNRIARPCCPDSKQHGLSWQQWAHWRLVFRAPVRPFFASLMIAAQPKRLPIGCRVITCAMRPVLSISAGQTLPVPGKSEPGKLSHHRVRNPQYAVHQS